MSVLEVEINSVSDDVEIVVDETTETVDVEIESGGGVSLSGSSVKLTEVILPASAWAGSNGLYSQVVEIEGVTRNSLVDLQPSVEQLRIFHEKDLAFTTENDAGVITIFAIGDKPANDYIIQATIMEVRL